MNRCKPDRKARGWKVEDVGGEIGRRCHGTKKVLEHCQRGKSEDRGALPKKEGDLIREYKATTEEHSLSSWFWDHAEG